VPLPLHNPTLGDHLRPLGLRVAVVGKTHVVPDRAGRVLRSEAQGLPEWLEGTSLTGIHAFGRRWAARVERGGVELEPA